LIPRQWDVHSAPFSNREQRLTAGQAQRSSFDKGLLRRLSPINSRLRCCKNA
jgi:hypothetical protein